MSFKLLIASIERQIRIEKAKMANREQMLAYEVVDLGGQKLPDCNPAFLAELEAVLPLLKYLSEPIEKISKYSDIKDEAFCDLICSFSEIFELGNNYEKGVQCLEVAQKFFHQYRPKS